MRKLFQVPGAESEAAARLEIMRAGVIARAKLGAAWHTRRLSPGTRAARLNALTHLERMVAQGLGWIAPAVPACGTADWGKTKLKRLLRQTRKAS